jgi:predicted DNA-binding transcriptional regulator YafY
MPDPITKTQRWLDLIAYLAARRMPVAAEELMERIPAYARKWVGGTSKDQDSVRRTFERDKDELREAGIPIETRKLSAEHESGPREAYLLRRSDFYLPYLRLRDGESPNRPAGHLPEMELTREEASLAFDALRVVRQLPAFPYSAEAGSAYRKVTFDLDPDAHPSAPIHWVEPPGAADLRERVQRLSGALLARKRVRFRYHGIARGETTEREVEPYGLFFQRDWYLVGHDLTRDAVRVFRVGRIEDPRPNTTAPRTPDYEVPDSFRLRDFTNREAWSLGGDGETPVVAHVRFPFPASLRAERNGAGELLEEGADGSAVRRFELHHPEPFIRWLLSQDGDAELLGPEPLVERLREVAARVAALHAGEPNG